MSDQDVEFDFTPEVQAVIERGLELHRELAEANTRIEELLSQRRAQVIRARARGVSGYRLARVFGVSQTTIGNWCQGHDD